MDITSPVLALHSLKRRKVRKESLLHAASILEYLKLKSGSIPWKNVIHLLEQMEWEAKATGFLCAAAFLSDACDGELVNTLTASCKKNLEHNEVREYKVKSIESKESIVSIV